MHYSSLCYRSLVAFIISSSDVHKFIHSPNIRYIQISLRYSKMFLHHFICETLIFHTSNKLILSLSWHSVPAHTSLTQLVHKTPLSYTCYMDQTCVTEHLRFETLFTVVCQVILLYMGYHSCRNIQKHLLIQSIQWKKFWDLKTSIWSTLIHIPGIETLPSWWHTQIW